MATKNNLISQLRSPDNKVAINAVEELRANGWLENGTLVGMNLQFAHLQGADLSNTDLSKVNLANSDLRGAVLHNADLNGVVFTKANLLRANFSCANVHGARFVGANLQNAYGLTDDQLSQADALFNTVMPDGSVYDGRFNLPGDIQLAKIHRVNLDDPEEMRIFYSPGESTLIEENLPRFHNSLSDQQIIKKLYSSDNKVVIAAVNELRKRGRLNDGSMEWKHLKYVNMQGVNLSNAKLNKADLSKADLSWANLINADLKNASFFKANLKRTIFDYAELNGANFAKANLYFAEGITVEQFFNMSRLRGAKMPDGKQYDGRYKLAGDLWDAKYLHFDINDPRSMADFYGITLEDFMIGQQWAKDYKEGYWIDAEQLQPRIESKTIIDTLVELYE